MKVISWPSIICYCIFSVFVFYQQLHAKRFEGGSQLFALLLSFSGFLGMLVGIAYLGYYGWRVVWWAPVVAFICGVLAVIPGVFVERFIGKYLLSFLAFIIWPLSAYFMFQYIPK